MKIGFIKSGYTGANTELKIHFARPCLRRRPHCHARKITPPMVFPRRPCAPVRSRFYARRDLIIVVNDGGSKAFPSTGRKVLRSEQARGLNAPSPSLPRYTAIISLKRADGRLTSDRHDLTHPRSKISLRRRFNVARQLCISAFVCFSNRKEGGKESFRQSCCRFEIIGIAVSVHGERGDRFCIEGYEDRLLLLRNLFQLLLLRNIVF